MTDTQAWERDRLLEALDSYKRGFSDAPHLRKWTDMSALGPSDGSQQSLPRDALTFVVSTDEVDRHGDIVSVEGWRLDAYRQNPVFLWAHNHTRPAIGRTFDIWKEGHNLLATMEFAPTPFAQEVATLYQKGFQRGVSVGFKPLQYDMRRDASTGKILGIHFIEQELLEVSAAPVPANSSALRKALDSAPRLRGYYLDLDPMDLDSDHIFEEILAALRRARQ